ncbi:MAG: DUF721 domain-containing protein [Bdellovibrionota bacterium]
METRRKKSMQPIAQFFSRFDVGTKRYQEIAAIASLRKKWSVIVGQTLGAKTAPLRLQKKTLTIVVESSTWAHHLSMSRELILENLTKHTNHGIEKVRFSVGAVPEHLAPTDDVDVESEDPSPYDESLRDLLLRVKKKSLALQASKIKKN